MYPFSDQNGAKTLPYPTPLPPPPYIISGRLGITLAVEKLVHALSTFFLFGLLLKQLDKLQYGLIAAARNSGKTKKKMSQHLTPILHNFFASCHQKYWTLRYLLCRVQRKSLLQLATRASCS